MKSDNVKILSARVEGNDRLIVELEISAPFGQFMADCAEQKPKPAVVPWEDSNIGDVVEINCQKNGLLLVNVCNGNDLRTSKRNGYCPKCSRCICVERTLRCPESPDVDDTPLCDCHPSDCDVYFTEVKE